MANPGPVYASHKRIILCADGTWNSSNSGSRNVPSNVARIARAIANNGTETLDVNSPRVKQIVFYSAGLGATDMPLQKAAYGAFGWGLDVEVCQMYDFISNNYEDGDELFFFGFSRGAYTVRSVASLIATVGVLPAIHMAKFADMWAAYRHRGTNQRFEDSKWFIDYESELHNNSDVHKELPGLRGVEVRVLGVWDTVGALGLPEGYLVNLFGINEKYKFHDLELPDNVSHAFQALAIDEQRKSFMPTVWQPTSPVIADRLQQCWFPGIHGNIGGPDEGVEPFEDIGDITFAWMVDNLSGMLTFERDMIEGIVAKHRERAQACETHGAWGCQRIKSNFEGLQGKLFRLLGSQNRTPGRYGANSNESIHPIARFCKTSTTWNPSALVGFTATRRVGSPPWEWTKPNTAPIASYPVQNKQMMTVAYGGPRNRTSFYQIVDSLSYRLCPGSLQNDLA